MSETDRKKRRRLILFGALGLVVLIGALISLGQEEQAAQESVNSAAPEAKKLIDFKVINHKEDLPFKVSWDIRVDLVDGRLPTEEELTDLSRALQRKNEDVERTFVLFYLPGMEVGSGAFAQAHHDPTLTKATIQTLLIPDEYKNLYKASLEGSDSESEE